MTPRRWAYVTCHNLIRTLHSNEANFINFKLYPLRVFSDTEPASDRFRKLRGRDNIVILLFYCDCDLGFEILRRRRESN